MNKKRFKESMDNSKPKDLMYILLVVGLVILFFLPMLLSKSVITVGDGIGYEVQFKYIKLCLENGESPFWFDLVGNGTSFSGDIQNKLFYPLTWLCVWLPEHLNFKVFYVLHVAMGGVFAYLFFRNHKCANEISLFGAIVFAFSNLIILRVDHINTLCALIWIPLILFFLEKLIEYNHIKYILGLTIAMALQFLAGFPQIALYSDIFVAIIYLYYCIIKKVNLKDIIKNGILIILFYVGLIAIQILPLAEIMVFSSRNEIDYSYFAAGSSDLRMLLTMLNPVLLGTWGEFVLDTAEFPTDMYLGIIPATLFFFSFRYMRKDKNVKILYVTGGAFLLLACACSNFPVLGKLIYNIPLLGSFRTTTRFLSVFIISELIISVYALQKIYKENMWVEYRKISQTVLVVFLLLLGGIGILSSCQIIPSNIGAYYAQNYSCWIKSIVTYLVLIILLYVTPKISKSKIKILPIIFAFITILDTYFINVDHTADAFRQGYMIHASEHEELIDSQLTEMLEDTNDLDEYNYYVSYDNVWKDWERSFQGIKANGNVYHDFKTIQSYITFNNPMLLELCSDPAYGMTMNNTSVMATSNPSLLSMLSVKYIIQFVDNDYLQEYTLGDVMYEDYSYNDIETGTKYSMTLPVDSQSYYSISCQVESKNGGEDLILTNGDEVIVIRENLQVGTNYISQVILGSALDGESYLCLKHDGLITLKGIRVEELSPVMDQYYSEIYNDGIYKIYRNDNARPILYASSIVKEMRDANNYIINNKEMIDFCEYSIIEAEEDRVIDYTDTTVEIDILEQKNDSVLASVQVNGGNAFINFTQNYYPGWMAYVDGEKREVQCVNGLIQGIQLNEGNHEIQFVYKPYTVWIGSIITVISLVSVFSILIYFKHKNLKQRKG